MAICESRGFPLHYEVFDAASGHADETPVLLIMGLGGTAQGWTVLTVPDLSQDRPCIVFDNRGAGESADPGEPYTTRDMADDAIAVLDAAGVGRAHVLGGFLGGLVAQEIALNHPHRVDRLAIVGSFARPDARRRAVVDLWKSMAEYDVPAELRIKNMLSWSLSNDAMEQTEMIERMWRFFLDEVPMDTKAYVRQAEAILSHDTYGRLATLEAPTLVVCGENDILTPVVLNRVLADKIPDSRFVPIPEAGHLALVEAAPRVNRLVRRFFTGEYA